MKPYESYYTLIMKIKDFSDRILAKQENPYDRIVDPFPYKYFQAIYHRIMDELEEDGATHTVFWHENRDMLPTISKAVMAQFLIILGERKAKKEVKSNGGEWEEMMFKSQENLIWGEIKNILRGK